MIRIVGVEHSKSTNEEFVLFQNQGTMREHLRGHALVQDSTIKQPDCRGNVHIFTDDEHIGTGAYVLLQSGFGEPRWSRSKDGTVIYITFANSSEPLWNPDLGTLHLLNVQHTYAATRTRPVGITIG